MMMLIMMIYTSRIILRSSSNWSISGLPPISAPNICAAAVACQKRRRCKTNEWVAVDVEGKRQDGQVAILLR